VGNGTVLNRRVYTTKIRSERFCGTLSKIEFESVLVKEKGNQESEQSCTHHVGPKQGSG